VREPHPHIIVLGAGLMGRLAVEDLLERSDARLTVADLRVDAAQALAALAPARVSAAAVDASDPSSVAAVLRGAGAVVNCVQYTWNLAVMEGALAARVPYVDLGGLFHTTRRQLGLHRRFADAGVTAILGLGTAPGIPNLHAARAAAMLDQLHEIRIYDGIHPPAAGGVSLAVLHRHHPG